MKKIIFTIIISGFLFAQYSDLSSGLGFAGGLVSGSGFSYRHIGDKRGFQVTGGLVMFNVDNIDDDGYFSEQLEFSTEKIAADPDFLENFNRGDGETRVWSNLGYTYYKPFHRASKSMFYGLVGASIYYSSQVFLKVDYTQISSTDSTVTFKKTGNSKQETEHQFDFFGGIGIGIEYKLTDNIRLHLEIPITIKDDGNIWMYIPQGGLHYYFK